jgi:acyl-CoA synthetase (AMP-forming)/AMP-acid ligase II
MNTREELIESFNEIARDNSSEIAIGDDQAIKTFKELYEDVSSFQRIIHSSLAEQNCIVAFAVKSGIVAATIELAIWKEGHLAMPLPEKVKINEAQSYIDTVSPNLLIIDNGHDQSYWVDSVREITRVITTDGKLIKPGKGNINNKLDYNFDALQIQFTSGSTGSPKALMFDAGSVAAGIAQTKLWFSDFPNQKAFSVLPQHHAMGRMVVFETLWSGRGILTTTSMALGDHKKRINDFECGIIFSNPTYIRFGLQMKLWQTSPCIKRFVIGTASVEPSLPVKLKEQLPEVVIDIRYGVSEAIGALTKLSLTSTEGPHDSGNVGKPLSKVRIYAPGRDEASGVVKAKADTVAIGLIKEDKIEKLKDHQGFIELDDLGYVDQENLNLCGRSNLFLKHRGYRIDPIEIENTILNLDIVREAVVVGVPDDQVDEKIIAVVESETKKDLENTIIEYCKNKLSLHKVPSLVINMDTIPRKPSGKPNRSEIINFIVKSK